MKTMWMAYDESWNALMKHPGSIRDAKKAVKQYRRRTGKEAYIEEV